MASSFLFGDPGNPQWAGLQWGRLATGGRANAPNLANANDVGQALLLQVPGLSSHIVVGISPVDCHHVDTLRCHCDVRARQCRQAADSQTERTIAGWSRLSFTELHRLPKSAAVLMKSRRAAWGVPGTGIPAIDAGKSAEAMS